MTLLSSITPFMLSLVLLIVVSYIQPLVLDSKPIVLVLLLLLVLSCCSLGLLLFLHPFVLLGVLDPLCLHRLMMHGHLELLLCMLNLRRLALQVLTLFMILFRTRSGLGRLLIHRKLVTYFVLVLALLMVNLLHFIMSSSYFHQISLLFMSFCLVLLRSFMH